jgi:threonine aldolase
MRQSGVLAAACLHAVCLYTHRKASTLCASTNTVLLHAGTCVPLHTHRKQNNKHCAGGGMRQSGVLAAACLYAIKHNLPRYPTERVPC